MKWTICYLLFAMLFLGYCQQTAMEEVSGVDGEALAKVYCSSCHLYPEPTLLDRKSWENYILPRMGYMLGIYPDSITRESLIEAGPGGARVKQQDIYPETPRLEEDTWSAIRAFYLDGAPDSLTLSSLALDTLSAWPFRIQIPELRLSPPSTTLVRFDRAGGVFLGDAHTQAFYQLDEALALRRAANVREGAVWLEDLPEAYRLCVMGSFSPVDAPMGMIMELPKAAAPPRVLIDGLQRPVHHTTADLNQDGLDDLVVCEFAKWTGRLAWWAQQPDGQYVAHTLRARPGATKAYVVDLNDDNLPDIIALFGQGDEGIFAYYNEGDGQFREEILLRFPAVYGSSYFQLFDYDGDAHPDILYTAGDNADFPPIIKPYHGIYIFRNNGQQKFEQVFFQPLPGAYSAQAADFDLDGDLDIAAISFFPDFSDQRQRGIVFLDNRGKANYHLTRSEQLPPGRWIVMDVADADGDLDPDILVGSLAFEAVGYPKLVQEWVNAGVPFVLLENAIDSGQK